MAVRFKIWLWLSVAMAVAGALLLYPIGPAAANIVFILVKIGMVSGLALLLFFRKKAGFYVWASFSAGAVVMTLIKWRLAGSVSFLIIGSIVVDILMPAVAYALMPKRGTGKPAEPAP